MSQCSQSTDGFIKTLFGPRVAVLCSQDAEIISRRNNLSFTELIRPFTTLISEIQVRDPTNQSCVIRDLHMTMCDLRCNQPDDVTLKQMLSEVVVEASNTGEDSKTMNFESDRYEVNINMSCSWFEAYRDVLTSTAAQKPHEFINHCLACLLVVSSSHPNPLDEFSKLSQHQNHIQHNSQHAPLRWMTPNTLKYYVLLHDNSNTDQGKARAVMDDLQAMYGNSACCMVRINSKTSRDELQLPDPWGRYLTHRGCSVKKDGITMNEIKAEDDSNADPLTISTEPHPSDVGWMRELKQSAATLQKGFGCCLTLADHDSLRNFMQEFASKGLIPHIEKMIRSFNEQVVSRKAIHRSLFRATRTLFGGGKAASAPALKNYGGGGLDSPELQVRKLADLFFICQMYEHAYHYYHSVRKDFANEQAWLHAAGASEMAALSNFMQLRASKPYPAHYVDSAIDTYLANSNDDYLAMRCALISIECLRTQGMYSEAASQFKRLVNESSDLQSAIVWEQVAQCHLRLRKPALRKFAFYILLAGHRYGKAFQRKCALMCYKSALQVYRGTGWDVAIDFINFTIGRLSLQLQQFEVAVDSFQQLLKESNQAPSVQAMYLNEYLHVVKLQADASKTTTMFTLPQIKQTKTTIRSTDMSSGSSGERCWDFLEESMRTVACKEAGNNAMIGLLRSKSAMFQAVVNEPVWVDVTIRNPLHVALALYDASLLLEIDPSEAEVENPKVKEFLISANSESVLSFYLNPHSTGHIRLLGVSYSLSIAKTPASQASSIALAGRQLLTSANLNIAVCRPMPKLDVTFEDLPMKLIGGEIKANTVVLANVGQCGMKNIKVAFDPSMPCLFANPRHSASSSNDYFLKAAGHCSSESQCAVQNLRDIALSSGEQFQLLLWLQSPPDEGRHVLNFMFYYESTEDAPPGMKYRCVNFTSDLYTKPSIELSANLTRDNSQSGVIVSAEVKNASLFANFDLSTLSCLSESWGVSSLAPSRVGKLDIDQTAAIYFQARDKAFVENRTGKLQRVIIDDETTDEADDEPPSSQELQMKLVSQNGKLIKAEPLDYLTVALQWRVQSTQRRLVGQHYIRLPEIKSDTNSLSKIGIFEDRDIIDESSQSLVALHQLVRWEFDFAGLHDHDFKKFGLCFVGVSITLQNQYDCQLRVNVNGMDSNQPQSGASPNANTRFLWAGKTLSKFVLQPKQSHVVTMKACFSGPGIYNLNSFGVWAVPLRIESKTPLLPQNCHFSSLITVHDSNYNLSV